MKIQVLIATMHQTDHNLLEKMNIQTDAVVGNQCDRNKIQDFEWNKHKIKWLSFNERGVGLNRNNTLMRADSDIVVFADDDLVYVDNYEKIINDAYNRLPDADVIIFNLNKADGTYYTNNKSDVNIHWFNYMKYGAARFTSKLISLKLHGILFNLCFGGGTEHSSGEDTLFLTSCLKCGLKIYAVPEVIAQLKDERQSTWFEGYTDKYFKDKGTLYKVISKKFWKLLCLQDAIRHQKMYKISWKKSYKLMVYE